MKSAGRLTAARIAALAPRATRYIAYDDVIVDDEAWRIAASSSAHPLAAWGPPVPASFLAPEDVVALARGEA